MKFKRLFECFYKCKLEEIRWLTDLIKLSRQEGKQIISGYKCKVCGKLKETE